MSGGRVRTDTAGVNAEGLGDSEPVEIDAQDFQGRGGALYECDTGGFAAESLNSDGTGA